MIKRKLFIVALLLIMAITTACTGGNIQASEAVPNKDDISVNGNLAVSYIDVGQADSILIQTPQGKNMLIDAGQTKDGAVLNYLNNKGITKLDVVVATHPHNDHISELDDVIDKFEIGQIYMPKVTTTTKAFENVIDAVSAKGLKLNEAKAGVNIELESGIKCSIVAPCKADYKDLNDWSAVIKLVYGDNSFLFTGDAEVLSENEILQSGVDISADVLKVGHHGSSSSTGQAFLDKVNPTSAVISVAEVNDYGHPNQEILDRLNKKGIKTYLTSQDGNIIAVSDGKNIQFITEKQADENTEKSSQGAEQVTQTQEVSEKYIGNVSSKKFHTQECKNLPKEQNQIIFHSRQEAVDSGYTPCGNCKP